MSQSNLQSKLERIRPPRVHIDYDVETGGAIQRKKLPFVLGVLSDLSGNAASSREAMKDRKFVDIDLDNFSHVMKNLNPKLSLQVNNVISPGEVMNVHLKFDSLEDFGPVEVAHQVELLKTLLERRSKCLHKEEVQEIDHLLSLQSNEIIHHPLFQQLEASWRGLFYLVVQTETSTELKIRVLDVTKKELLKDLQKCSEFDQSYFFKKIYEEEYGTFGGAPFGALIGDYEFGPNSQDMELLEKISNVAAAAHAPFISAASPQMFNAESFADLPNIRNMNAIFDSVEYAKWRSFRNSEDARFIGLTLPRILMRVPYGPNSVQIQEFDFREMGDDESDNKKFLWGNASYAVGVCFTNAFAKYGWCASIRGVEGGGLVQGLPTYNFKRDDGGIALKCPTEIAITDRREKELNDIGFIPLVHCRGTDYAAFFGMTSCQKPTLYDSEAANANSRLSSQLQYILTTSRFAHYVKAQIRDKVGSFMTRGDCENYLNRWINNYVVSNSEAASLEIKAKYPLREARIDVGEIPGNPGLYKAVMYLKPHFLLDDLSVSLRMVVVLPAPVRN